MSTTNEQEQAYIAAAEELSAANENLHKAIVRIRDAAKKSLKAQLSITDEKRRAVVLARIAYDNKSTWSGGPASTINIREDALRRAAIELLQSEIA